MTRPDKFKVVLSGVDVSDYVYDGDVGREFSVAISTGSLMFNRTLRDVLTIDDTLTDEYITIQRGIDSPTEEYIFRGYVTKIKKSADMISLGLKDKYSITQRKKVTTSFDRNINPEGGVISEIFKTLLSVYAPSLDWDDTTIQDSGELLLLDKFECRGSELYERLDELANYLNWQHYYDPVTDKIYLEPKGFTEETLELEVGVNVLSLPEWEYNTDLMSNVLTINGALQAVQETVYIDGDGTEGQKIPLEFQPKSMKIYAASGTFDPDNDVKPSNNENNLLIGGKRGSTSGSFDYQYDDDQEVKTIYFFDSTKAEEPSYTPPTGTKNIEVQYEYDLPTPVFGKRPESIQKYGEWEDEMTKEDIKTVEDATSYLNSYLDFFSTPLLSTNFNFGGSETLIPGRTYPVIDSQNNISRPLLVEKVTMRIPYRLDEIQIGDEAWKTQNFDTNLLDRLSRLEEQNRKTSDLLVQVFTAETEENEYARDFKFTRKSVAGETGVYGNPVFGVYGTAKYGSEAEGSFVLGSDTFGILGTGVLGDQSSSEVEVVFIPGNNTYREFILDDDFYDTQQSSGVTWDDTNMQIDISGQGSLQTTRLAYGIEWTSARLFVNATSGSVTAEITTNGDDAQPTWQTLPLNETTTIPNSTGAVKLRLIANGATTLEPVRDIGTNPTRPAIELKLTPSS